MENKIKKPEGELKAFVKTVITALILAGIIRSFFFEPFHIPSGSMKPGLLIGDYILVSKYRYGYSKYSFPLSLNLFSGRFFFKSPNRGDVSVFRLPSNPNINYIKRIVGIPGDNIQVIDGILHINKEPVDQKYIGEFIDDNNPEIVMKRFLETLPNGVKFDILDQYPNTPQDNTKSYFIPKGYYFAMGDNRDNSQDSRFAEEIGLIPEENLVGQAKIIFFSTKNPFWQFWKWHQSIRFKRLFLKIT